MPTEQVQLVWQVDVQPSVFKTVDPTAYTAIVRDYGGNMSAGHASFRRYRVAEIHARILQARFGLIPIVSPAVASV